MQSFLNGFFDGFLFFYKMECNALSIMIQWLDRFRENWFINSKILIKRTPFDRFQISKINCSQITWINSNAFVIESINQISGSNERKKNESVDSVQLWYLIGYDWSHWSNFGAQKVLSRRRQKKNYRKRQMGWIHHKAIY